MLERHHLVTWSIDIFGAETPEDAARQALAMMVRVELKPGAAACFAVTDKATGKTAAVDLVGD